MDQEAWANLAVVAALLAALIEVILLLSKGPSVLRGVWRRTPLGRRLTGYKAIRQLRPNVQLTYFKERLGEPLDRKKAGELDQYIFVQRLFYVQAVVDENEQVVFYAVTSRHRRFQPRAWPNNIPVGNQPQLARKRLHQGSFTDFGEAGISGVHLFVRGATAPTYYVETRGLGNPGFYQTYLLGLNECGPFNFDADVLFPFLGPEVNLGTLAGPSYGSELLEWLESEKVVQFRAEGRPNTYGITAHNFILGDERFDFYLGPHLVDARTWPEEERSWVMRSFDRIKRAWDERKPWRGEH